MKNVLLVGGIIVIGMALLDMFEIPLKFPTDNNAANLAIGVGMLAAPYVLARAMVHA